MRIRAVTRSGGPDTAAVEPGAPTAAGAPGAAAAAILTVNQLSVSLGGREVLHRVSFKLGPGEVTGLIGSNGAGKTTLLRAILGLVTPTSGEVLVAGRPRSRRNPLIGYVPQTLALDPDMPVRARDLVGLGLDGHRLGIPWPSAARRAAIDEVLAAVDATHLDEARVGNLSGGEQQRVMIAHALISRPKLLLLDEPLANLDLRSEEEVVALLARIATSSGIAVLISAHDMNPLLDSMDRVIYLAAGRATSGTTEEVVRTETLSALYGHRVDVIHVNGRVLVVAGRDDAHCEGSHTRARAAPARSAPPRRPSQ
ncbi:MAG: metal ABC transporter ATP-binding protein [Acidimicrobiales bacterium]